MRFSIEGFSQARLVELGCDATDAVLLRWFADFVGTGKMATHDTSAGRFYWVRYEYVIEQLPILGVTNRTSLGRRFKRLADAGILAHLTVTAGGTFSYFGFGPEWKSLVGDERPAKVAAPRAQAPAEPPKAAPAKQDYEPAFEAFWKAYARHVEKQAAYKAWKARKAQGASNEELELAATNYTKHCNEKGTEMQYRKHPATFLGPAEPWRDWVHPVVEKDPPKPEERRPGVPQYRRRVCPDPKCPGLEEGMPPEIQTHSSPTCLYCGARLVEANEYAATA